jgi:hypothetical protein
MDCWCFRAPLDFATNDVLFFTGNRVSPSEVEDIDKRGFDFAQPD